MTSHQVSNRAPDKATGMTVADLITFVKDCERVDLPRQSRVRARVGFRGQVQELIARSPEDGDPK